MSEKTNKELFKTAIDMAWPSILESFFMSFAGLVDSLMVSTLGAYAVAAVGLTTQPKFIGLCLFFALGVALSALVARRRGADDKMDANRILATALAFIVIAAVIISITTVSLADTIIALCGSEEATHDSAVLYFRIIMGGMLFNCISIGINAAQRGAGNTKITMRTNVTSNTINIIFNYLLINGHFGFPALGIKGAALATVGGSAVACVMSIASIMKKDNFVSLPYIYENKIKPTLKTFSHIVAVGYSVFIEQLLMRIGFVLTAVMAADQGTNAMAAHQVGMNLLGLTFSFGDGLQSAAVALIGRSLGAMDKELAKRYGAICRYIGFVISIILALGYLFGGRFLMGLFFKEADIVAIGVTITRIIVIVCIFQVSQVIYMGCLRGAGDTAFTAKASTISVTIVRTVFSYFFGYVLGWGITGIWMGIIADQASRFVFASIRFKQGKWVDIKI